MKKLQQGFTLIELMIVVAIIGILAAIAVPAYQDYTIRSRVSEGASLAAATRTAVDVTFAEGTPLASMPTNMASLGLSNAGSYTGKYVNNVTLLSDGRVQVNLKSIKELGTASGTNFVYKPTNQGGNLSWAVSAGSIPVKYLPRT